MRDLNSRDFVLEPVGQPPDQRLAPPHGEAGNVGEGDLVRHDARAKFGLETIQVLAADVEKTMYPVPRRDTCITRKLRPHRVERNEAVASEQVSPELVRLLVDMELAALPGRRCREEHVALRVADERGYEVFRRGGGQMLGDLQ